MPHLILTVTPYIHAHLGVVPYLFTVVVIIKGGFPYAILTHINLVPVADAHLHVVHVWVAGSIGVFLLQTVQKDFSKISKVHQLFPFFLKEGSLIRKYKKFWMRETDWLIPAAAESRGFESMVNCGYAPAVRPNSSTYFLYLSPLQVT